MKPLHHLSRRGGRGKPKRSVERKKESWRAWLASRGQWPMRGWGMGLTMLASACLAYRYLGMSTLGDQAGEVGSYRAIPAVGPRRNGAGCRVQVRVQVWVQPRASVRCWGASKTGQPKLEVQFDGRRMCRVPKEQPLPRSAGYEEVVVSGRERLIVEVEQPRRTPVRRLHLSPGRLAL